MEAPTRTIFALKEMRSTAELTATVEPVETGSAWISALTGSLGRLKSDFLLTIQVKEL
jgi:hypothetical protein